jgi:hypothetical protein
MPSTATRDTTRRRSLLPQRSQLPLTSALIDRVKTSTLVPQALQANS